MGKREDWCRKVCWDVEGYGEMWESVLGECGGDGKVCWGVGEVRGDVGVWGEVRGDVDGVNK